MDKCLPKEKIAVAKRLFYLAGKNLRPGAFNLERKLITKLEGRLTRCDIPSSLQMRTGPLLEKF